MNRIWSLFTVAVAFSLVTVSLEGSVQSSGSAITTHVVHSGDQGDYVIITTED